MRRASTRRHRPTRWTRCVGAALLCLLAACGDEEDQRTVEQLLGVLDTGAEAEVNEAVRVLARRARSDPGAVVPQLADALRNYEGDRYVQTFAFRVDAPDATPEERRAFIEKIAMMMPQRLADYGRGTGFFVHEDERLVVRLTRPSLDPPDMERHVENVIFQLSAPGTVQLRLVVTDPDDEDEVKSLWKGDGASYRAYLKSEATRLSDALKADGEFVPKDPAYRTVLQRPGPQGGTSKPLIVYEARRRAETFNTNDMEVLGAIDRASGEAVLEIKVDRTRHADMEAWSKEHHSRLVAVLLNGNAMLTTRIGATIRDRAVLPVGMADAPETLDWMKAFVMASRTGPYPARVVGELLPAKPEFLDLPIARAMVLTGAPAESALREIEREGGPIAPVARWALGEMTRRATGQGNE